jgi:hypothetical protein
MHKPNTLQEAIRLALEFEAPFKGNDYQRGFKRRMSLVYTSLQENVRKPTLATEMDMLPRWPNQPIGFHKGDRKAQPQL